MDDFDVQIKGLREVDAMLTELAGPAARRALRKGMRQGANVVRDEVRNRAARRKGLLRRSIRTRERSDDGGWMRFAVEVMRRAFYGYFGEYGTSKQAAKPFMRPGAAAKAMEAVQRMRDAISEAIQHEVRKARR